MAISYTLRLRSSVLPQRELVLLFWRKGALPIRGDAARRIQRHLTRVGATGEEQEMQLFSFPFGSRARTLVLVGLGKKSTLDTFRRGVANAIQQARQMAIREIAVIAPEDVRDFRALGAACVEGAELGGYAFTRYHQELAKRERTRSLRRLELFCERNAARDVRAGMRLGEIFSRATIAARNLVNEPSSHVTPAALADAARRIARDSKGAIRARILDRTACHAAGMGAFLAVAQGSVHPPFFIHLTYTPTSAPNAEEVQRPVVALIGKGITFDSGGLSLKPAESMETMKIDMAGAASVFGVFSALRDMRCPLVVHGFVAACENMPSGSAMKPGDIVRSASGKTIEIRNTDAEGRLTLADSITEARKVNPSVIIDLATLTGACIVSLGEDIAGLFANDEDMVRRIVAAAHRSGEAIWPLPLVREYRDQIKSTIADLKNITGKRWGGAITAALFLQEFIGDTPWVHLDIAGPSYAEQQTNPVVPVGGSGFGVRTVLRFLQKLGAKQDAGTSIRR